MKLAVDNAGLRVLLDLADRPKDVAYQSGEPTQTVSIPDELYQRYLTYQSLEPSTPKEPKKKEKP
jgi:hypothetical protein